MQNRTAYITAAAISLTLSVGLVFFVVNAEINKTKNILDQQAHDLYQHVNDNFKNSKVVLDSVAALFQTMGEVDNDQLSQYSREMLEDYPYLYAVEYFTKVDNAERVQFESDMRESGYVAFSIKQYAGDAKQSLINSPQQTTYFPLVFMQPLDVTTAQLIGLDGLSDSRFSAAFKRAIATGEPSMSAPVDLMEGGQGLMLFKAVYTKSVLPVDLNVRTENTFKIIAVLIRIDDLLSEQNRNNFSFAQLRFLNGHEDINTNKEDLWSWSNGLLQAYYRDFSLSFDDKKFNLEFNKTIRWEDIGVSNIVMALMLSAVFAILVFWLTHLRLVFLKDKRKADEAHHQEKEKAEITLYSIGDAVITTDIDGGVEFLNLAAEELIGMQLSDVNGRKLNSLMSVKGEENPEDLQELFWTFHKPDGLVLHKDPLKLVNHHGSEYVVEISISPIHDLAGDNIGFVLVLRDVGHIRKLSFQLEYQATHDPLTDLANRSEFERRLDEALIQSKAYDKQHALCYMDLDQFKIVNDSCGHLAGDHLLKQLATVMKSCMRDTDLLARLGGDEFGVLLFDCPVEVAETIVLKIKNAVSDFRFVWDEHAFDIGISIGLVPICSQSISTIELMRNADTACYVAKDNGRNRIHLYQEDDSELAQRFGEMQWVQRIRNALQDDRFFLAVQDVVSLSNTDNEKHREVLLRLHGENGETIPPMAFIPAAERYELMPQIDRWVFCKTIEMIGAIEACDCLYNINISGQSLKDEDFSNYARNLLAKSSVEPHRICFEITETAAISNLNTATQFIHSMKELGIRFALDDFGRGMSSFGYLKTLPVDYLKIDGSFVRDMANDAIDYAMVESITRIGHVMGLKVIAEFVENDTTVELLRELGVDYGQGYGIHKPETWLVEKGCPLEHRLSKKAV
ncbi:MAG: EAL domain-containing protein [Gammaproteobacteria bacterium]|nr:EAL domain-containing protein [Gammaproteobacteria bacterium]